MARKTLPSCQSMQAFDAAARHLSFTRAADELHLTQGAISQQIKLLEERLRVKLFSRNARSLTLTSAGQFLYPPMRNLLSQMEHIVDSAHEFANGDELVVYVPPCIGTKWLMPRIAEFRKRHSKVHLCLNVGAAPLEMTSNEMSVSITIGADETDNTLRHEYLERDCIFPVCSPGLLSSASCMRKVSDLTAFELLDVSGPHRNVSGSDWLSWLVSCGEEMHLRKPTLRFGNSLLAIQAAVAGSGIALARGWVAEPDLHAGALVKPLNVEVDSEDAYYLAYRKDLDGCEQIACFREWLVETIASKASA